jgi:transposase
LKKRHRYGTLLVNQEDHQVFDLIESRDETKVIELLKKYPNIKKITRDGSYIYARAISKALPNAIQISDRFHLIQNLTIALKGDLILILPAIIRINDNENPDEQINLKLTQKEKAEILRHQRNQEMVKAIRERYDECGKIQIIIQEFDLSYRTVKKYLANDPVQQRHDTISSLTAYFEVIYNNIKINKNSYQIFKEIKELGYTGTFSNMLRYIRVKQRKGLFSNNVISRGDLIQLLFNRGVYDLDIGKEWQDRIIQYLKAHKRINSIIMLVSEFRIALFSKKPQNINKWLEKAKQYPELKKLQSFINGTTRDIKAVENAVTHNESNGVVEGIVCKIKKIKRIHYGRCNFQLLKQKILP